MILKNRVSLLFAVLLVLFSVHAASAELTVPERPLNHVVDLAGIIDANVEAGLNRYLLELEQKTTAQMVILTVKDLEDEDIFDVSLRIAHDKWKLGQKGKDNGVLMMVSLNDKKYWTQVGYGLEGVLPDSLTGSIGRTYLVPYFRKGDYSTGITAAAIAMINEIASDAGVEITGMPKLRSRQYGKGRTREATLGEMILGVIFLIGLIYLFIKHPRLLMLLIMMNMLGGGRRSGWSGGGGFGGGGSFGGGGGGGFGGGGAGGGW